MDFDSSWNSLFKPGDARTYFRFDVPAPPPVSGHDFCPTTAYWLAELSRLAYQPDSAIRQDALQRVGWTEVQAIERGRTLCCLFTGNDLVAVVFRGTSKIEDWMTNLDSIRSSWPAGGTVHRGFREALETVWDDVSSALDDLSGTVYFAGHSLGGALALLASSLRPPSAVYSFGAPRLGDRAFARSLTRTPHFRVVNRSDLVASLPPSAIGYKHVGRLCYLTGDGVLLTDPPRTRVYASRIASTDSLLSLFQAAPDHLADHAPVNYVELLAEQIREGGRP